MIRNVSDVFDSINHARRLLRRMTVADRVEDCCGDFRTEARRRRPMNEQPVHSDSGRRTTAAAYSPDKGERRFVHHMRHTHALKADFYTIYDTALRTGGSRSGSRCR